MELIVISAPDTVTDEAQIVNRLFGAGLQRFHLRKPGWDLDQCTNLITQIDQAYHHAIVCHQHHRLAKVFEMHYLHYPEKNRIKSDHLDLNIQLNQGYRLSTSVHDVSATSSLKHFEYTFLSPVFNSISKQGYQSMLPAGFCLDRNKSGPKIIALGGVDITNLNLLKKMNFDGAAVLGAIWQDPKQAVFNFISIKKQTEQLNP
ncbi:thiamine-phosphate pyrophosphorylase [Mucilaginibacter sp. SG538B]|uniref:thiamine phosphate synthase n=1 Tax=Mucilaginibacter sp. SG538B TaxID=2587021 RepID=UPI00159D20E7|nr:thiamine phosphate synthase [Mucilaginibacter sp. SG538B]NVM65304.1 thiamine-phosphate pyrophosphorylase [Mucilaginibacter sp. SG538B]